MSKELFHSLKNKKKIIWGPFTGENGWEITRWSGAVREYKKRHPKKIIYASTRESRTDLYHGCLDGIHTFKINGDYTKYRSNMYRLDFWPEYKYNELIHDIKLKFEGFHICSPPRFISNRNFFSREDMNFDISPRQENSKIIKDILSKHSNKIPICISPRHRTDSLKPTRNWREEYWEDLFKLINDTNKYVVFILGIAPSYIRPRNSYNNFIIIEDIIKSRKGISAIGTTIEAIKHSVLTIGQQSALPVLSNYLRTPTIMWGHEKVRHRRIENPLNTKCIFFEELSIYYNTNPNLIFEAILKESV